MEGSCTFVRCPPTRPRRRFRSRRSRSSRRSRPSVRSGTSHGDRGARPRRAPPVRRRWIPRRSSAGRDPESRCGCGGSRGRGCAMTSRRRAGGSALPKSVSIARTPAAASASFSSISSVVSDFTFTTSVTPCARAIASTSALASAASRAVERRSAAGGGDRVLELDQVAVEIREHLGLDRPSRLAELFPVRKLGDDPRPLTPDRRSGVAHVRA